MEATREMAQAGQARLEKILAEMGYTPDTAAVDVFQAMMDAAPCPWTKIGGLETLPSEGCLVSISFGRHIQEALYSIKYHENGEDFDWMFFDTDSGTLELLSDCSGSDDSPTHWMHVFQPEPPK